MKEILDWTYRTSAIPDAGLSVDRDASDEERAAVAKALGLVSIEALETHFRISAIAGGYRLQGKIEAPLDQACIVTLDPIRAVIREDFNVEFQLRHGSDQIDQDHVHEASVLDLPDVEDFDGINIPVGRIVFESLAAGFDPYPRKAGAEFSWRDEQAEKGGAGGPFADLSKLKRGS